MITAIRVRVIAGRNQLRTGKPKSQIRPIPTREAGVTVATMEGRVPEMVVTSEMSDADSHDESSDRRELEKARVADTPDEDPRVSTTETAQAETAENDTNE